MDSEPSELTVRLRDAEGKAFFGDRGVGVRSDSLLATFALICQPRESHWMCNAYMLTNVPIFASTRRTHTVCQLKDGCLRFAANTSGIALCC